MGSFYKCSDLFDLRRELAIYFPRLRNYKAFEDKYSLFLSTNPNPDRQADSLQLGEAGNEKALVLRLWFAATSAHGLIGLSQFSLILSIKDIFQSLEIIYSSKLKENTGI